MMAAVAKPASERRTHRGGRPKVNEQCRQQVIELYNNDVYIKDIAARCNISQATVYRIVRESREDANGVTNRRT